MQNVQNVQKSHNKHYAKWQNSINILKIVNSINYLMLSILKRKQVAVLFAQKVTDKYSAPVLQFKETSFGLLFHLLFSYSSIIISVMRHTSSDNTCTSIRRKILIHLSNHCRSVSIL